MKFIIHQSIAAQQDLILFPEAEKLFKDFSVEQHNLSCSHKIILNFNEDDFKSSRIRESHVVFLSGLDDLDLISRLKQLENRPFIVWSTGSLSKQQISKMNLPIDVCLRPLPFKKTMSQEGAPLDGYTFVSSQSLRDAYKVGAFQKAPVLISSMVSFKETLSERIRYAVFGKHASSTKVIERQGGGYEYLPSRRSRERAHSAGELFEKKFLKEMALTSAQESLEQSNKADKSFLTQPDKQANVSSWPFWATVTAVGAAATVVIVKNIYSRR